MPVVGHVLIVDDESDLAQLLEFNLRQAGYDARVALTGTSAMEQARADPPELILLDVQLPDLSGVDLCRELKNDPLTRAIPVVMLTARGDEPDRVSGLEAGADDYIAKPFSVRELVLRLRVVLRRAGAAVAEPTLVLGRLKLEPSSHRCFVDGEELTLTVLEYRLLQFLMKKPGQVHSREALLQHVWGMSSALETRTIDTHVMRVREKLGGARSYLQTVRGIGYRLNAALAEDATRP